MLIFILKSSNLKVDISDVDDKKLGYSEHNVHKHIKIVYLAGPLFFGTQEQLTKKLESIENLHNLRAIVFSMRGVPQIDDSAISELESLYKFFSENGTIVLICGVPPDVVKTMDRAGFVVKVGKESFLWDAITAFDMPDECLDIPKIK